jgi:hypothetical protein
MWDIRQAEAVHLAAAKKPLQRNARFTTQWLSKITVRMLALGYLSDLGECLGDHALTEIRRFQMAEKPPSRDNSTPFR